MKSLKFKTLDECINCYGRGNLVAIDNLSQIIFYTKYGVQPKFVCENEYKKGKISAWFLKCESAYIYDAWIANRPSK